MHNVFLRTVTLISAASLIACIDGPTNIVAKPNEALLATGASKSYTLLSSGTTLPATLAAAVAAIGGTVVSTTPQIGMAVVTSDDPGFRTKAAKLSGISSIGEDPVVQWLDPNERVAEAGDDIGGPIAQANPIGSAESFRLAQWAPDAVNAPAAWAQGQLGAGARVAILDSGIDPTHVDLQANYDLSHSASFVPGFSFNQDVGTFWHGIHVAGIVGAPENNVGIIGIAPQATLIGVKVLHGGSGQFSWLIQAIVYAALPTSAGGAGAHIINMSLGALFLKAGPDAAHLTNLITRATTFATQLGVLVVAAAGNNAVDFDQTANVVFYPAQAANVVSVSATGPLGWATGAPFNLDRPASYTNYGQSAITFAGPGGDFALPGSAVCSKPRIPSGSLTNFCWVFDMVLAPASKVGSTSFYAWAAGTSMAAPAVSGVAALVIGKFGAMTPAQLRAKLQQSADDLGKPGNDNFYGGGRVNAGRAVQ
jgi:subtilisin family serine protease